MSEQVDAIFAELIETQKWCADNQRVVQIRIEPKAPPGSIVAMPMSGEIAERFKERGVLGPREILVNPDDWRELIKTIPRTTDLEVDSTARLTSVLSLPVIGP